MTEQEHLLTILAEECAEVAQRVSKALRFGIDDVQPGQDLTNADGIEYELADLAGIVGLLREKNILTMTQRERTALRVAKQAKINEFMRYAVECGTLAEAPVKPGDTALSAADTERLAATLFKGERFMAQLLVGAAELLARKARQENNDEAVLSWSDLASEYRARAKGSGPQ